jgi:hypothetical protein
VVFDADEHLVVGLAGTSVRLRADSGIEQVVLAGHLMAAVDFAVLDGAALPATRVANSSSSTKSQRASNATATGHPPAGMP